MYGSVFDPNNLFLTDVMNDQGLGGDAYLDPSFVEYDWQLSILDYQFIIKKPLVTYIMTNSDGSLFGFGTFYVTENTTTSLTINSLMTSCIDELNSRCTAMASSIATDDDNLIQNIDILAVIEESNRHLNEIDDFVHMLKNL